MKVLSDNQINSVVGAGFWSDVRDKFREHFSSDHSKSFSLEYHNNICFLRSTSRFLFIFLYKINFTDYAYGD